MRQQIKIQCAPFNKVCTYTFQLHKYPFVPPPQDRIWLSTWLTKAITPVHFQNGCIYYSFWAIRQVLYHTLWQNIFYSSFFINISLYTTDSKSALFHGKEFNSIFTVYCWLLIHEAPISKKYKVSKNEELLQYVCQYDNLKRELVQFNFKRPNKTVGKSNILT